MKTILATALLALPAATWAATTVGYEAFGDTAGVVLWRGEGSVFHEDKVAAVAADGTVGEAGTMTWGQFCKGQGPYASPGKVLVYDAAGYAESSDAQFSPLSLGGLWVKALADETEVTPYSVTGSNASGRYTDFGVAGATSLFKFDKDFKIDRSSATRCYGDVTIDVAQDAAFENTAALWIEANSKIAFTGKGTVVLWDNGLRMNSSSTLDLSAEFVPKISGNVTLADGSTLVLPAGTSVSSENPFYVCHDTLAAEGGVNVKIGDDDAFLATLTVDGGSIVGIEALTDATFDSDYPTVVPAGLTYTFVGGTESEPVVLDARDVRGTLKTQGYFTFTNYKSADSSLLDVDSGSLALSPGSNWLKGTLTIEAGATFVNNSTDAPNYNGTFTANVHGTLDMGATRWSLGSGNVINLYEGCTVTGSGQSGNGTLDWIDNAAGRLNVYGPVTVNAPVKIRDTATVTITVDSGANEGLTLAGETIAGGKIVKNGAGLLSFAVNPTFSGITVNNGALTFETESDVTATVTYPALPTASTSLWYAQQSNWKGLIVVEAFDVGSTAKEVPVQNWGNQESSVMLKGISGNAWLAGSNFTVQPALLLDGNVNFQNGSSGKAVTFREIAGGTGNLSLKTWSNCTGITYGFTTLNADEYTGTIALDGRVMTFNVGDIIKTNASAGDKLVGLTVANNATVNLSNATLNGGAADLELKSDGIYVAAEAEFVVSVDGVETSYDDFDTALIYAGSASGSSVVITVVSGEGIDSHATGAGFVKGTDAQGRTTYTRQAATYGDATSGFFTIENPSAISLPSGKTLNDVVEGTTLSYAQAYVLGIYDPVTKDVSALPATIEIVDGNVRVTLPPTATTMTDSYNFFCTLQRKATLDSTSEWTDVSIGDQAVKGQIGTTLVAPASGDAAFYRVRVVIAKK